MTDQESSKPRGWMAAFFLIWSGQAVSLLGSQLVQFALIWWLTQTTGSATVLATAVLVSLLPQILLGPVAGRDCGPLEPAQADDPGGQPDRAGDGRAGDIVLDRVGADLARLRADAVALGLRSVPLVGDAGLDFFDGA